MWSLTVKRARAGDGVVLLPDGAVVRRRRAGDRLRLAGMRGHKKLQDYYVDRKVPRRERDGTPVIATGSDVWWTPFGGVASLEAGAAFRVTCERR
jgi:tRNA(Ile)-lysidine synthetase-like protein